MTWGNIGKLKTRNARPQPLALLMSGYGINCERETAHAFDLAHFSPEDVEAHSRDVGGISRLISTIPEERRARVAHVNEVIENPKLIRECQILVWPGGFSMGDDTGSGLAYANYARDRLGDQLREFIGRDTLSIGICNGFQIMSHLGFFPVGDEAYLSPEAVKTTLTFNTNARYRDLWTTVRDDSRTGYCAWTDPDHIGRAEIPIAHGEGRFHCSDDTLHRLKKNCQVVFRYSHADGSPAQGDNPNGSLDDIAGICDQSGRFLGMMPHPERAIYTVQHPQHTKLRYVAERSGVELPETTVWMRLFRNAVKYFD